MSCRVNFSEKYILELLVLMLELILVNFRVSEKDHYPVDRNQTVITRKKKYHHQ